ncbi:site-specific DNA-methyltransferase [Caproicibacterium sp. NSD3]
MDDKRKVSQEIFDSVSDGVQKLAQLFPSAVKDGEVDFNALKEELGQFTPVGAEKYELNWAGKSDAKRIAREDILGRTLKYVPQDSKNADTTENVYIEGDNLEVLKLLRQNYYGTIKMIYIDPPYNTGKDFVYHDDFTMSGEESAEAEGETVDGERMVINQKSTNRFHANWLNMMYPRLKVAKDLLREDGVIFISIDDNEVAQLRKICDEVFGEINFIAQITVLNNPKGRSQDKYVATCHEFLLCYSKSVLPKGAVSIQKTDDDIKSDYPLEDERGTYREVELRNTHREFGKHNRPNLYYPIYVYDSGQIAITPISQGIPVYPIWEDGFAGCWTWGQDKAINNADLLTAKKVKGSWKIYRKSYSVQEDGNVEKQLKSIWIDKRFHTEKGQAVCNELFETKKKLFQSPKAVDLITELIKMSKASDNDIIIDFFSGSATTAHAVMQLNAEDGGNRKFIMVQVPEVCDKNSEAYKAGFKNICEIGKERIRRAGEKIKTEIEQQNAQLDFDEEPKQVPDIGFKVFCTADTNIRWTHEALKAQQIHIDESMLSDKDKLDFMPGFKDIDVVYEILLHQRDIPLSAEVEKRNKIGERTYFIADTYLVCLEETITKDMLEKLAAVEPLPIKYILRDSAFEDNISLKDETIRRLEALIARNSGENEQTYTVEFI